MQTKAKGAIYEMELKKLHFESLGMTHEGKQKLIPQMWNAHTRARE